MRSPTPLLSNTTRNPPIRRCIAAFGTELSSLPSPRANSLLDRIFYNNAIVPPWTQAANDLGLLRNETTSVSGRVFECDSQRGFATAIAKFAAKHRTSDTLVKFDGTLKAVAVDGFTRPHGPNVRDARANRKLPIGPPFRCVQEPHRGDSSRIRRGSRRRIRIVQRGLPTRSFRSPSTEPLDDTFALQFAICARHWIPRSDRLVSRNLVDSASCFSTRYGGLAVVFLTSPGGLGVVSLHHLAERPGDQRSVLP
jgi:hypothetical protein